MCVCTQLIQTMLSRCAVCVYIYKINTIIFILIRDEYKQQQNIANRLNST